MLSNVLHIKWDVKHTLMLILNGFTKIRIMQPYLIVWMPPNIHVGVTMNVVAVKGDVSVCKGIVEA